MLMTKASKTVNTVLLFHLAITVSDSFQFKYLWLDVTVQDVALIFFSVNPEP